MKVCIECAEEVCLSYPRCEGCGSYRERTNADRIRAMSDEELAAWLADDSWDCHNCSEHERLSDNPLLRGERCDEKCAEHCLDWLRQLVKDGENE